MPFAAEQGKVRFKFNFTDLLALLTVLICLAFQWYAAFFLSKVELKDNTTLIQILTNVSNYVMLILTFYFGSNLIAARSAADQNIQIAGLQKAATDIAMNKAEGGPTPGTTVQTLNTDNVSGNVHAENLITKNKDNE